MQSGRTETGKRGQVKERLSGQDGIRRGSREGTKQPPIKEAGRKERIACPAAVFFLTGVLFLAGCSESGAARQARLSGISQMEAGDFSGAVASFETALSEADGIVNAFELDILKYRGEAEYRLEDYAAAAHTYGILAEVDEGKPEYLYYKAASEAAAGNLETAETDFASAEALASGKDGENPESVPGAGLALTALSGAAREAGEAEKAADYCRQAIARGYSGAELYNEMGVSLLEAGSYSQALEYFEQGLSLAGSEEALVIRRNMGALYEKQGDFAKALELFRSCAASGGMTPELEKEIAFLESR